MILFKRLLTKILCTLSLFIIVIGVSAAPVDTLLGHQAPKIIFQQSLNKGVGQDFYHHKLLVLDFWATWCAPCIAGFPHFNQLSGKYGSDKVVFAAISNESLQIAQRFFSRTGKILNAVKLIDTSRTTMNEYGVLTSGLRVGIPYCVVIDEGNVLRWAGNTYNLTDNILDKIIHGERPQIISDRIIPQPTKKPENHDFFSFNVARSDTGSLAIESSESYRTYDGNIIDLNSQNQSLSEVIELISGFSEQRFVTNNISKIKQHIDINYKIGTDTSRYRAYEISPIRGARNKNFIISMLGELFKFTTQVKLVKNKHFELIITDTTRLHSFKSMNPRHHSYDFDHAPNVEIIGYNLKDIATYLESDAKTIIVTHIPDKALYDFSLDVSSIEVLNKSLEFHGLKVVEVNDYVELMYINFY